MQKYFILIFLLSLMACNTQNKEDASSQSFDWLMGNWQRINEQEGKRTFEHWKKMNDSTYHAFSYTLQSEDTVWQENISLEYRNNSWMLNVNIPDNSTPTSFKLTAFDSTYFVCENKDNEFPTHIAYHKGSDTLKAKIYNQETEIPFVFKKLKADTIKIKINSNMGFMIAEIYPNKAPISGSNFIRYIENNKFTDAHFYRVVRMNNQPQNNIKIEVIQGGLGFDVMESPYPPIAHETTLETGILHQHGTLSMARAKPGTASSEFFICIGDQPSLDYGGLRNPDGLGFAAFGKITKGMEVVQAIQQLPDEHQMLTQKVNINSIDIIKQ